MIRSWAAFALLVAVGTGCGAEPATRGPAPSATAGVASASASAAVSAAPVRPTRTTPAPSRTATSSARSSVSRSAPGAIRPLSEAARAAGLVDIRTVVADAVVDLRYATADNFVGVPLYPADARCLVHESMAAGLKVAAGRLRRAGFLLVFWDCYRPHPVQVLMFRIVPDPSWVARPGPYARSHEAGRSVDVTLAYPTSQACPATRREAGHCLVEMGTGFDDFTARAHAFAADGVSPPAQANRRRLRLAMNSGGITVYSGEWWHFNGPGASVARPHLGAPVD